MRDFRIKYILRPLHNLKKRPLPLWERARVRGIIIDIITAFTLPFIPSHQGRGTIYPKIH